jgi:hypothetical protein
MALSLSALESHLWESANILRGPVDATDFKTYNFIINFPTKDHWRGTSTIEFIRDRLVDLAAQARRLGIRSIAVPPLSCGNGGLDWAEVPPLIEDAFEVLPEVKVRLFEPAGAPDPKSMACSLSRGSTLSSKPWSGDVVLAPAFRSPPATGMEGLAMAKPRP